MTKPERREQLLDVTRDIVWEDGFHEVSIEAVARRAGITRPVVYEHFGDLGGLLEEMLGRETARALAQLGAVLPSADTAGDTGDALLAALRGYLDAVAADPVTWRLVLMPPEGAPEILREQIGLGRDAVVAILAEVMRPGLAPGLVSPDPALTARLLSALADEAARLMLTRPEDFPRERLMDHAEWLLGCLTRPG
ncbi:MAG TPA: TetR/AcrR family transcriptional regulator [Thermoleophilaceae bacterium]|nr:TetR/AcrR family transcriptional regulator [Thermoleophilaceae bacterium]